MTLLVACNACGETFDACRSAGLVRCAPCEDRVALRLPGVGAGNVLVLDTPDEAWA